jgi:hypothetical protein
MNDHFCYEIEVGKERERLCGEGISMRTAVGILIELQAADRKRRRRGGGGCGDRSRCLLQKEEEEEEEEEEEGEGKNGCSGGQREFRI